MLLLGIDVGTTNSKAVVLDAERGEVVAVGHARTPRRQPRPDWREYDPEELWAAVAGSVRAALARLPAGASIGAVAVASMGEAGLLLDGASMPLCPIISWDDTRAEAQCRRQRAAVAADRLYALTGQVAEPKHSVNKLLWLREHATAVFQAARHWLCVEDYVLFRLSGELATDHSIASRTLLFDQARLAWSDELLGQADLPRAWFPAAHPSGSAVGRVRRAAAAQTGLPEGALVVTGGHDHLCGALAAGAAGPDALLASIGTAGVLLTLREQFRPDPRLMAAGFACYASAVAGCYAIVGGLDAAGGALEWLVDLLYGRDDPARFERALADAAAAPLGAGGLVLLPHFLGSGPPHNDERAGAALVGLTPRHDRGCFARALLEGLGYWLRANSEALGTASDGGRADRLIVIGSPTRSPFWLQIIADTTGCTVQASRLAEATATGAALLAGVGAGVYWDAAAATSALPRRDLVVPPAPAARQRYDRRYRRVYARLYATLADLQHAARELADEEVE